MKSVSISNVYVPCTELQVLRTMRAVSVNPIITTENQNRTFATGAAAPAPPP